MDLSEIIVPETKTYSSEGKVTVNERFLVVPLELQNIGVAYDNDVERIYFELPRYFDEVNDLSTFNIYVNYINAAGNGNVYHCEDLRVEGGNITFSWLTSKNVYEAQGTVQFTLKAIHADGREWNSTIAELKVLKGLNTQKTVIEKDYDFINQQFEKLNELTKKVDAGVLRLDEAKADAESARNSAESAHMAFQRTKESEFEARQAAELAESKVKAVDLAILSVPKLRVEGNPIVLNDTVEQKVPDVLPYISQPVIFAKGSTVQGAIPNPDKPVGVANSVLTEIGSVGKNLLDSSINNASGSWKRENGMFVGTNSNYSNLTIGRTFLKKGARIKAQVNVLENNSKYRFFFSLLENQDAGSKSVPLSSKGIVETLETEIKQDGYYCIYAYGAGASSGVVKFKDVMLYDTSLPSDYEPYKGQTIKLTKSVGLSKWDSIEIRNNIVGKVNGMFYQDLSNQEWSMPVPNIFRCTSVFFKNRINKEVYSNLFVASQKTFNQIEDNTIYSLQADQINIRCDSANGSIDEFKRIVRDNNLYIIYPNFNPIFEPLPETDQQAILNMIIQSPNSTIMTDTGITLSINYIADTKKWVLKQIKELNEKVLQTQKALL